MKFGSWTYDGFKVTCDCINQYYSNFRTYVNNGEWHLLGQVWKNCKIVKLIQKKSKNPEVIID